MVKQEKVGLLKVYESLDPETQARVKINAEALKLGIKDKLRNKPYGQFSDDMATEAVMAVLSLIVDPNRAKQR